MSEETPKSDDSKAPGSETPKSDDTKASPTETPSSGDDTKTTGNETTQTGDQTTKEAENDKGFSFDWKTAAITAAVTVGVALLIIAVIMIVKKLRKDKEEDKGEEKSGKEQKDEKGNKKGNGTTKGQKTDEESVSTQASESDHEKMVTAIDKKTGQRYQVKAVLGEDGRYHVDGGQLKKSIQDNLTAIKNDNNNSINETKQQQEEINQKMSDISKELEATKAKLDEQQKTKSQVEQLAAAMVNVGQNVFSKMLEGVGDIDLIDDRQTKEVKTEEAKLNTTTIKKAKEEKKGNAR